MSVNEIKRQGGDNYIYSVVGAVKREHPQA